ncbi:hypothetical protein AAVH_32800, partial [Aphelenchoides avenae]
IASLQVAYAFCDRVEPEVIETEVHDVEADLHEIAARIGPNAILVATTEDVRQTLHPSAASHISRRDDSGVDHCSTMRLRLPHVFYKYVAADVLVPALSLPSARDALPASERVRAIARTVLNNSLDLTPQIETVDEGYTSGVCCDSFVDSALVVRARGLPWQASDQDIALFFAGLNIAPGGIALCLSAEGRRNGEAMVRFECAAHRELALQRHRKFLQNRYIEVYRGTGEDFLKVAVGADSEAVRFASRDAAMIVRMRGLPFDCTEQQISEFFSSDGQDSGIIDQGILFVNRPDGRPSGDAFVMFGDEVSGKRALSKHKNRIGSRYIELFRTTQAEVQQVFNRTARSPQGNGVAVQKKDCVRLRGLPYEAQVQQVVDFLGAYARHIVFQGVHMIYNNQGHPSGEAIVQMDSENAAAMTAQAMHNKYMEMGKKKRYIEVFQCSPDDMNLVSAPITPTSNQPSVLPQLPGMFPGNVLPVASGNTGYCSSPAPNGFPVMGLPPPVASQPTTLNLASLGAYGRLPNLLPSLPPSFTADQLYALQCPQMPMFADGMQLAQPQLDAHTLQNLVYINGNRMPGMMPMNGIIPMTLPQGMGMDFTQVVASSAPGTLSTLVHT